MSHIEKESYLFCAGKCTAQTSFFPCKNNSPDIHKREMAPFPCSFVVEMTAQTLDHCNYDMHVIINSLSYSFYQMPIVCYCGIS